MSAAQLSVTSGFRYVRYWRESPRDQLFTGAGIAVDQYRGFRWRDEGDFTEQVLHRRAFTDHTELAGSHRRCFSINTVRMRERFSSVACRLSKSSGLMR